MPALGRPIGVDDDRPGAAGALVLSDRFWRLRFAADPEVIGRTLTLNGRPATIVGVAPPWFTGVMAPLVPDVLADCAKSDKQKWRDC